MHEEYEIINQPLKFVRTTKDNNLGVILYENDVAGISKILFCDEKGNPIVHEMLQKEFFVTETEESCNYDCLDWLRFKHYRLARDDFFKYYHAGASEFIKWALIESKEERRDYYQYLYLQQATLVAENFGDEKIAKELREKLDAMNIWIFSNPYKVESPDEVDLPEFLEEAIGSDTLEYRVKYEVSDDNISFLIQTNPEGEGETAKPIILAIPEWKCCKFVDEISISAPISEITVHGITTEWQVFNSLVVDLSNGIHFYDKDEEIFSFCNKNCCNDVLHYKETKLL